MVLYQSKFFNHIASVLSERGLRCGAVYHPLYNCYEILGYQALSYCALLNVAIRVKDFSCLMEGSKVLQQLAKLSAQNSDGVFPEWGRGKKESVLIF